MVNSGPRRSKYRAGLNHTGDDDRVGHCQSLWHLNATEFWSSSLVKKIVLTMDLSLSKQSVQQCCCSRDSPSKSRTFFDPVVQEVVLFGQHDPATKSRLIDTTRKWGTGLVLQAEVLVKKKPAPQQHTCQHAYKAVQQASDRSR